MHRSGAGRDPFAALGDGDKRRLVTGLLGQAFVVAYNTIQLNKERPSGSPTASSPRRRCTATT